MVRFLKVSHLEEERRVLVARSEIHRRMLHVEKANLEYSVSLLKQRFGVLNGLRHLMRLSAPLTELFLARKQRRGNGGGGFVSSVLSGIKLAADVMPFFRKTRPAPSAEKPETDN